MSGESAARIQNNKTEAAGGLQVVNAGRRAFDTAKYA